MSRTTIQNLIISLFLLLSAIGGFLFMLNKINKQGDLLVEQINTLSTEQTQENSFYKLQRIAEESAADRKTLAKYFLHEDSGSIDFLNQIEALAPAAGVELNTDSHSLVKIVEKETGANWIEVGLSFSGSKERTQNFIKILENLPYSSHITQLNLSARSQAEWQAKITIRVRVLAYGT